METGQYTYNDEKTYINVQSWLKNIEDSIKDGLIKIFTLKASKAKGKTPRTSLDAIDITKFAARVCEKF